MATGVAINGAVLAELRLLRGLTQQTMADACQTHDPHCGIDRDRISGYEREKLSPGMVNLLVIRAVLDHALPLADREWRALIRTPTLDTARNALNHTQENRTNRRQANRGLAAAGPTALSLDAVEQILHALDWPTRLDLLQLDRLYAYTGKLAEVSFHRPPGTLIEPALAQLATVRQRHSWSMTPAQRMRLHVIGVHSAALVGWLYHLTDRPSSAADCLRLAFGFAREAESKALDALLLGFGSLMSSTVPSGGARGDAASARVMAEEASRQGGAVSPRARAWLAVREAIEHAVAGQSAACWRAFEGADQRARDSDERGFFGAFFGAYLPGYPTGSVGLCHLLLGDGRTAETVLLEALGELDLSRPEYPAVLMCDLTAAYVEQDEPEQACRCAGGVAAVAEQVGLPLVARRVRSVRGGFPQKWAPLSCVATLDERLRLRTP